MYILLTFLYNLKGGEKMEMMMLSKRIRLLPTKEQEQAFLRFAGTARWCWNECLSFHEHRYQEGNNTTIQDCIEHLQDLKYNHEDFEWLQTVPETITKRVIKDLDRAYKMFFKGTMKHPRYKKKGRCKMSFFQREDRFRQVDDTHVKITGIKTPVKIRKCNIPTKIYNSHISYDNKYWYLSFSYYTETFKNPMTSQEVLGVDLGLKTFAVVSNGRTYNRDMKRTKKLQKRKKRLQRKLSKKYENSNFKKTSNIEKLENTLRLLDRKISNIRKTFLHTVTKDLVRNTPRKIVIEDLDIRGMLKNRHLSKSIQEQAFYMFRDFLTYKCKLYNIPLQVADRYFPSSKMCSTCKSIKKDLKLSDRIYICEHCHTVIDRDFNASLNLASL